MAEPKPRLKVNSLRSFYEDKVLPILIWLGHPLLGALTFEIGQAAGPVYAALWVWLYLKYETNEDHWIHDRAYIDVKDFMIGFGVRAGVRIIWYYCIPGR